MKNEFEEILKRMSDNIFLIANKKNTKDVSSFLTELIAKDMNTLAEMYNIANQFNE